MNDHSREQGAAPAAEPVQRNWLTDMLSGMGIPGPQDIIVELRRLNNNIEELAPTMHTIAATLDPENMRNLITTMQDATSTGRALLDKLK